MKKARVIDIPLDRPLTLKEYDDFSKHAINSMVYSLSRSMKSERELRDKLRSKGYIDDPVEVLTSYREDETKTTTVRLISEAMQTLRDLSYLDEEHMAQRIAERELNQGRGPTAVKIKLMQKGFPPEIVESTVQDIDDDTLYEAIERAARKYMRTSAYRKEENDFLRKQKLVRRLLTRGFSFSDVNNYIDDVINYVE